MSPTGSAPYDPARSLALLWGPPPRPGRSGLSLPAIIGTATELADAHGLAAVSMRQVAQRLGVGTMSLYGYVPGKGELTELMIDGVYAGLYRDLDEPLNAGDGWPGSVRFIAERNWQLLLAHPWLLEVTDARPVLGPHLSDKYEAELRPFDGIGLTDLEMDSTLGLVTSHVAATARLQINQRAAAEDTGETDAQWWETVGPVLERLMPTDRYPLSGRVGVAAGEYHQAVTGAAHALAFGLERIIDGIAALIDQPR